MVPGRKRLVWVAVACAAVVAQVVPTALCRGCDQPCCADLASGCSPTATELSVAPAGGCPLCAAAADLRRAETNEQPCHCQLNARHDQSLSLSRSIFPTCSGDDPAAAPVGLPPLVPQAISASREYVAASLTVPIRPPRILFGVWRN